MQTALRHYGLIRGGGIYGTVDDSQGVEDVRHLHRQLHLPPHIKGSISHRTYTDARRQRTIQIATPEKSPLRPHSQHAMERISDTAVRHCAFWRTTCDSIWNVSSPSRQRCSGNMPKAGKKATSILTILKLLNDERHLRQDAVSIRPDNRPSKTQRHI